MWKNAPRTDYIGLNHYRRYFADNTNTDFIGSDSILENLSKYPKKAEFPIALAIKFFEFSFVKHYSICSYGNGSSVIHIPFVDNLFITC